LFFRVVFSAFIGRAEADQYIAGCIILAAAPCTAMVFVWSHLTNGNPSRSARPAPDRDTPLPADDGQTSPAPDPSSD
jgi:hypothetical protein